MRLIVGPLAEAARLCAEERPSHLLSWLSPPAAPPELSAAIAPRHRLLLTSHDVCAPGDGYDPPNTSHLVALLDFAAGWDGERPMLIHCWAGVSRSTAAAYAIACLKRPDLAEAELAARLRAAAPSATPNPLIVQLADDQLGRAGRMARAIAGIGRGCETGLGAPFALRLA